MARKSLDINGKRYTIKTRERWEIRPTTRIKDSKKVYKRARAKQEARKDVLPSLCGKTFKEVRV